MYHGTNKERGLRFLHKQRMEYSRGDDHWLGDGIYLYRDKLCAYRWINIKYNERYSKENIKSDLYEYYMILKVILEYDEDRLFSFLHPENKMEFDRVKEKARIRSGWSKRMDEASITDGVVLNIMFSRLGYNEDYDIVEGAFPLEREDDKKTRLLEFSELQYCVKNPNIIKSLDDCTNEFDYETYSKKLSFYYQYRKKKSGKYRK